MAKAKLSHDLSFIKQDTVTEIGLMLAKDKNLVPIYGEFDDPSLAQQFFSGEPGYANLPPEKEVQIAQDDWRSGVGQEIFDTSDKKRYWKSINMDLRFKGMAQCGPLATIIVKPAGVVRAWAEFNGILYIGVDNILGKLNTATDVFDTVHTFAATVGAVTFVGAGLDDMTAQGTFTGSAPIDYKVQIDGVGSPNTFKWSDDGGSTWDATGVAITGAAQALNNGVTITFAATTGHTNTEYWTFTANPSANITDLETFTDGNLYIALGKTIRYNYMTTGEAFTISTLSDGQADYFQTVNTNFWKTCKPRELKSAVGSDPTNAGSWSTATNVGSTSDDVTALAEESGNLYVIKEDMPWYIDKDGAVHRLIPGLKTLTSTTSGVNSFVWKAKLYIPCGTQSLVEYDCVTEAQSWRDPADFCDNLTEYTGRVQALTGDDRYLYAITDNNGFVELLAGRLEEIDGSTDWAWHPLAELTLTGCQIAFVSSIHKKRLYVASTNSANSFYYYPLPTTYGDIDSGADYTFQTDGYFITPWHHANFKADYKAYIKITLTMGGAIDTNIYFEGHYRIKGVSAWTDIGDFQTAPRTTKYIPVTTGAGLNPTGVMVQFKFVAKTNDTSTTPKLLGYDCRGIWYPAKRWIIGATVQCKDGIETKRGRDDQTADTIKTALEEANGATYPVTFYDVTGSAIYVKFLSVRGHWHKVEKDRNPEWVYDLILSKVTTTLTGTARSWDAQWDSFVWG